MIEYDGMKFYSMKEAGLLLNISTPTIRQHIKKGHLKASFMFGRWYISDQHIREYLERANDTATNTAAAIRATASRRKRGTARYYAVGVHAFDVTPDGITPERLQIIPIDVTPDELAMMEERNFYIYSAKAYAEQIRDALIRDGFAPERVPVFDPMTDHGRDESETNDDNPPVSRGAMAQTKLL